MIPDFRTYLNESLWADVQSQASGDVVKKEDDIDLMSLERFHIYLKENYNTLYYHDPIEYHDDYHYIAIPIFKYLGAYTFLNYMTQDGMEIELDIKNIDKIYKIVPQLMKGLRDNFSLDIRDSQASFWTEIRIHPKDESEIKNSFVIQVIDNILDSLDMAEKRNKGFYKLIEKNKTDLKESLWADIQGQASGNIEKKEDDISLMDGERFCEYLKKRYDIDNSKNKGNKAEIHYLEINGRKKTCLLDIPLFLYNPPTFQKNGVQDKAAFLYYPDDQEIGYGCTSVRYEKLIKVRLSEKFVSQESGIYYKDNYFHNVDNEKAIEFLEFMIDIMKDPLIPILKRK